jgi:glycosyltransferase involved in cell wall biosynthesis
MAVWFAIKTLLDLIWHTPDEDVCEMPVATKDKLKVAYVGVYGIACGIATYNEELIDSLKSLCDVRVFAEYADTQNDPEFVTRCWDRNEHPKGDLIRAIEEFNPDVIHIGHEYGLFPKGFFFTSLITRLKHYGKPIVVTLHSVYEHLDKSVQEGCIPNVICHTDEAKNTLVAKGIADSKITVVPHGNTVTLNEDGDVELLSDLWNTWQTPNTIFQPGFLFAYKGHRNMIKVIARLKEQLPDVHYIVQASENPNTKAEHDALYEELMNDIFALGLQDNVTINRGFAPKQLLMSHIRTVKCCVLPYCNHEDHNVRATSGIARMVLTTETPLITSRVHLFDDIDGIVDKATSEDEFFEKTLAALTDWKVKTRQIEDRKAFMKATRWDIVAHKTLDVYKSIV